MDSRCSLCPRNHRQVFGHGNRNARIALIGEGPGAREDEHGIPFVGPSGQELDETYLPLAGLSRDDVWVTNTVQCRQERNGQDVKPGDALAKACAANHLGEEVWDVGPDIIVLLGTTACSIAVGGESERIDLELEHGRPRHVDSLAGCANWSGWVVPMYHPAAGMRDGRYMIYSLEDWEKLGLWLRGKLTFPSLTDKVGYELISSTDDFWSLMESHPEFYDFLPVDTESNEGKLWSIQFSTRPGRAFMFLAENKKLVEAFDVYQEWNYNGLLLHNAPHDLDELEQVGIKPRAHRDTMQELYHLGNQPQGLKAAVYRTLGHRMTSYRETVVPYSRSVLDCWLNEALVWASERREVVPHPIGPDCLSCGKKHRKDVSVHRPHEAEAVLRRILGKLQDDASEYDPWQKPKLEHGEEKPRLLGRAWLDEMERELCRMPRASIVHVPIEQAVQYGCGDADFCGRLGTWLDAERGRIVKEEWRIS